MIDSGSLGGTLLLMEVFFRMKTVMMVQERLQLILVGIEGVIQTLHLNRAHPRIKS